MPSFSPKGELLAWVCVYFNGAPANDVGGTSLAAPRWAGFMALVNQQAVAAGNSTVGFINSAIYAIGESSSYLKDFRYITPGGNNDCCGQSVYWSTVNGYDLVTGWGSPYGQNFINALAGTPPAQAWSSTPLLEMALAVSPETEGLLQAPG